MKDIMPRLISSDPRLYPSRPWLGVGIVVWKGEEVLLVRRRHPPRQGQWALPGGVVELGETVLDATVREVREEAGIEIEPVGILTTVDLIQHDEQGKVAYHYLLVQVTAEWRAGDPVPGDDASEAIWVPAARIQDYMEWTESIRVVQLALAQRITMRTANAPR